MKNNNFRIQNVYIVEVDSMDNVPVTMGLAHTIDYLLVKKELKEEFEGHPIYLCLMPMLGQNGRLIYY